MSRRFAIASLVVLCALTALGMLVPASSSERGRSYAAPVSPTASPTAVAAIPVRPGPTPLAAPKATQPVSASNAPSSSEAEVVLPSRVADAKRELYYREHDVVRLRWTSYVVGESWWSDQIDVGGHSVYKPDARWLSITIGVRNTGKRPHQVPSFRLTDGKGATFAPTWILSGTGRLRDYEVLNPDVSTEGVLRFDVPDDRNYMLLVEDVDPSEDCAVIKLAPRSPR